MLREIKFGTNNIKTLLVDSKAVSHTLPHVELKEFVPFKSDEDVITVLNNTDLTNALYAKVSHRTITPSISSFQQLPRKVLELKVNCPNFVNTFVETLFHKTYRAIRAWPVTASRSEKIKAPEELNPFLRTYIAKHVRDKMDELTFRRG